MTARTLLLIFACLLVMAAPALAQDDSGFAGTLLDRLNAESSDGPVFTMMAELVELAGDAVRDPLDDEAATYTLFIPSDATLTALLDEVGASFDDLRAAIPGEQWADILRIAVVPGTLYAEQLRAMPGEMGTLLFGEPLGVRIDEDEDSLDVLTNWDGARYTVVAADIAAANGVIHVIDGLFTSEPANDAILAARDALAEIDVSVAEVLAGDPQFSILAEIIATVQDDDAITLPFNLDAAYISVYAPTDAAFESFMAAAGIDQATLLAEADLAAILRYHVMPGYNLRLVQWLDEGTPNAGNWGFVTYGEALLSVRYDLENIAVNEQTLLTTYINASNGVIFPVDAVLVPVAEE